MMKSFVIYQYLKIFITMVGKLSKQTAHEDIEYLCCPGQLWPNTEFSVTLKRSYHKYLEVMIMSFVLILTGLTVALMSVKFYRRFYILVFVPLTIIWLQVYIADKIPIVGIPLRGKIPCYVFYGNYALYI